LVQEFADRAGVGFVRRGSADVRGSADAGVVCIVAIVAPKPASHAEVGVAYFGGNDEAG
jgi:hypothetical protein